MPKAATAAPAAKRTPGRPAKEKTPEVITKAPEKLAKVIKAPTKAPAKKVEVKPGKVPTSPDRMLGKLAKQAMNDDQEAPATDAPLVLGKQEVPLKQIPIVNVPTPASEELPPWEVHATVTKAPKAGQPGKTVAPTGLTDFSEIRQAMTNPPNPFEPELPSFLK